MCSYYVDPCPFRHVSRHLEENFLGPIFGTVPGMVLLALFAKSDRTASSGELGVSGLT